MKLFKPNSVSVVVPVLNEVDNLRELSAQLQESLNSTGRCFEIIFVDDGSTDGSNNCLQQLAREHAQCKVVTLRRNYGQTAAMSAGIELANNDYIVTIDGDMQNDPADIPQMLEQLDEGYDLVHGWRKDRQDRFINRKLPSKLANWLISKVTRYPVHDLGCTLKAMRREVAQELELYGQMHRFIPILADSRGASCVEIPVRHHPRKHGVSKYGINRTFRVILDLMTVKYMISYFACPMQFFGKFGLWSFCASGLFGITTVVMKLAARVDMTGNPFLLLCAVAFFASLQFFSMGILGEVAARNFFSNGVKQSYDIRSMTNLVRSNDNSVSKKNEAFRSAA